VENFPLSKPQKLIYDLERFAGGSVSNITASILFEGQADVPALQKAVDLILEHNDAFRLRILPDGMQTVADFQNTGFLHKHFSSEKEFHAWAAKTALVPIDPAGPLFQITIITINDALFGALVNFHHLIADAWSAAMFASRLYEYYGNLKNNTAPQVQRSSYKDYLASEQTYLAGASYQKDKAFWAEQFAQFQEPVFLSDKTAASLRSRRKDYTLSKSITSDIRQLASQHGLSVFSVMLTALSVYIARIKDASRFNIGTTVLNRLSRPEKNTFGMFVNTVALPVSLDLQSGFAANAQAMSENLLPVLRHQRYNHNDVLQDIRETHGYNGKLYDVLMNYQNAAVAGMDERFLATYWYHSGIQPESLQIQVNDRDNTGELYVSYDYQTEKLTQQDIVRLHERLTTILQCAIKNPDLPVSQLDIMTEKEQDWLVRQLNATVRPLPEIQCIHRFFELHAAEHPDDVAVIYDKTRFSYQELNHKAEQVADLLRGRGIQTGGVVALLMERCAEMMPIILGAMKAGCAYMPIATSLPRDRIDYMLTNSEAAILFYQSDFAGGFSESIPAMEVAEINALPAPLLQRESANDKNAVAYIIYTSGSTGRPKGVQVEHHSVCNRLLWMHEKYPLEAHETLIQKTNYAFDVSVWELFLALMTGRTLLVPPPGVEKDPPRLIQYIKDETVHKIHFVPSMLAVFLDYMAAAKVRLPELRQVIVSGEALTPSLNKRFYALFAGSGTTLHNLYGPTECTVDVLFYDCKPEDTEIPIGRPVWNTQAFVVDKNYALLPQGIEGELALSGVQLARGYVDTSLNAGRFVDGTPFGRIYMTGDKATVREDGEILYLGRNDDQVKIRGQRVELTEIEAVLLTFPGINGAAVLFDSERLIAFYKSADTASLAALEAFLSERLPSYMVPAQYIKVKDFPLNANGKLARKQLLELAKNTPLPDTVHEASKSAAQPSTEQERQILATVAKHLKRDDLSIDDNLLQSGLTSLQIISIIAQLAALGTELKVNDFYTLETVRALADNSGIRERPVLHVYHPNDGDTALLCIPYGGGSFGSFATLAAKLNKKAGLPVIAVQSAHVSPDDLIANLQLLPYKKFFLLGCCVGSALTIKAAKQIEAHDIFELYGVYLVSSIPPKGVRVYGKFFNPWKVSSQSMINRYLRGLSEKEFRLGSHEIAQFREDVGFFLRYLAAIRRESIQAPVSLIYGKQDPMIKTSKPGAVWSKFFQKDIPVITIDNAKHYIIHTHTNEIVETILSNLK
jgi:amino acid adenylation domain-containing protein